MEKLYDEKVDETIYTETLANGLRVSLLPKSGLSKTYAIFTTAYGANDLSFIPIGQTEKVQVPLGVAHFLEHKLFDKGDHDAFADFGKLGAMANAYTNATQTAYLFAATENVEENVELLLNFAQDPYFTDETVEREKGIITQEAQMYLDQPEQRLYMAALEAMFAHHPIKNPVIGTLDSIQEITKDDLYTCYHTFYHPSNMTLCIIGNMDAEEMLHLIRTNQKSKHFAPAEPIARFMPEEPKAVAKPEVSVIMPVSTPKCAVAIKEYGEKLAPEVLQQRITMTNMLLDYLFTASGPFYKQLYDEGVIDYSFGYQNDNGADYGFTLLSGNTNEPALFAKRVKELLLSTNELGISEVVFERMKKREIGHLLRSMNAIENIAQEYVWHQENNLSYFEQIPVVQSLTLEEMHAFIHHWIEEDRLAVCSVLPE